MVGVDVAEYADPLLAGGIEPLERHLRDLEVGEQRVAERLLCRGFAEVGEQAVVTEHGQPRVLERDSAISV